MTHKILVLKGDGIGPEIMEAALQVLEKVSQTSDFSYALNFKAIGGVAIEKTGHPLPEETLLAAKAADAILLGAVGNPIYDQEKIRPEQALLDLRRSLGLYANLRPVKIFKALKDLSPVKPERLEGVDLLVVRELTGGIYFGEHQLEKDAAQDVSTYQREEIERVLELAFQKAEKRRKKVTSIAKQNVLATSKLWYQVAEEVAQRYPDVTLEHQLVDSASMLLITDPRRFDVLVTDNLFGDILSDEASVLSGSLGLMPSSSHAQNGPSLYEPIHGSAPDLAGRGLANPSSMILSLALMFKESFGRSDLADRIERALEKTFSKGVLTRDLGGEASTKAMLESVLEEL